MRDDPNAPWEREVMQLRSGLAENLPYSLSRWTDVPHAKWGWFTQNLEAQQMVGFDPRTAVPSYWSLKPEDTLGLIFWTKDPTNLLDNTKLLDPFRVKVHLTLTGWHEVEKGAPDLLEGVALLKETVSCFGPPDVTWRFSPVPIVPDVVERFGYIAQAASRAGLHEVFVSFLQENDLVPESRQPDQRFKTLSEMAQVAKPLGLRVLLCNEDRLLQHSTKTLPTNLASGICAPPEHFMLPSLGKSPSEGCGCALAVDPFTINESCTFGCRYCYAADKNSADRKRNTTRGLPVVQGR